ncbi:MAG: zinc-binding dehydrogenase [Actinobacteria bacterium]|uniref:Unannotated protein n=1 Tax=freshwater metagenome TaxID=449393 RepID=A0A6J7VQ00_9ZZZZ|nr:zinc-binding dehydrogenase [Actinomycetota bacterium]
MTTLSIQSLPATFAVGSMTKPGGIEIVQVPTPKPNYGEALIRIEATAICTWEQRSYSGAQENEFPFVGGHESAGIVVSLGPDYRGPLKEGDRVAVGGASCGACHWCLTNQNRVCPRHYSGSVSYDCGWGPGGFAEYKIHPSDGLAFVGDVSADVASLTEPLSCAVHAARIADVKVSSDVVVIGAGTMGLMNVVALKQRGARVIVSEVDAGRLAMAKLMGADVCIDASTVDPVEAVKELTEGRGADTVVTAIGHKSANDQGLAMLAQRGTLVLFASAHPETPIEISPNKWHNNEKRLLGVLSSEKEDFYIAARMIRYGLVDVAPLIQGRYPLSQLAAALDQSITPGSYRIIVQP